MNSATFDEQCRFCRFLNGSPPCRNERLENVKGVDVCVGYESQEV